MFQTSQLTEISSRFPAHVQDLREFLLKEQLPVPSPDAIPQLLSRLGTDARFRADVGSLTRAILYEEREGIGYEDLLGILVVAAAGTEHDLKGASQETDIREMLRFLLQSRRPTSPPEPEPVRVPVQPEPRRPAPVRPAPVRPAQVNPEPVLQTRGSRPAVHLTKFELRPTGSSVAVAEDESREPDDLVLSPFRSTGLFAAQAELESPWWGGHSARTVGVVCTLLGLGLGLMIHHVEHSGVRAADIGPMMQRVASAAGAHLGVRGADIPPTIRRVVSATEAHLGMRAADTSSSKPETVGSVAPKQIAAEDSNAVVPEKRGPETSALPDGVADARGVGTGKAESAAAAAKAASTEDSDGTAAQPASEEAQSAAQTAAADSSTGMPVTVVKQVVTAFPSQSLDPGDPMAAAAATKSIVPRGSAGVMPANVIFSPPPRYPVAATIARVEGEVTVRAVVDPQGKVIHTQVVSGPTVLRGATQEAVQRWRYRPLLYNGKPIATTTVAIVDFKFAR